MSLGAEPQSRPYFVGEPKLGVQTPQPPLPPRRSPVIIASAWPMSRMNTAAWWGLAEPIFEK